MEPKFDRSIMRVLRYFGNHSLTYGERGKHKYEFFERISEGVDMAEGEARRCILALESEGFLGEKKIAESMGGALFQYGLTEKGSRFLEEQNKKPKISKGIPYIKIRSAV